MLDHFDVGEENHNFVPSSPHSSETVHLQHLVDLPKDLENTFIEKVHCIAVLHTQD